ncbi:hypothetical protein EBR43_10985 [bacterium]|nr:hypothetical protein [bacterium]
MIRDDIESFANYDNDFIKSIAEQAIKIDSDYKAQKISKEEYIELLEDLNLQKNISQSIKDLAIQERLNKLVSGLILAASAL